MLETVSKVTKRESRLRLWGFWGGSVGCWFGRLWWGGCGLGDGVMKMEMKMEVDG